MAPPRGMAPFPGMGLPPPGTPMIGIPGHLVNTLGVAKPHLAPEMTTDKDKDKDEDKEGPVHNQESKIDNEEKDEGEEKKNNGSKTSDKEKRIEGGREPVLPKKPPPRTEQTISIRFGAPEEGEEGEEGED